MQNFLISFTLLVSLAACSDTSNHHASGNGTTSTTSGGDWESSGGSGVACFKTPQAAEEYDTAIATKSPLRDEVVASIETLKTLEYWEDSDLEWITGESSEEIIDLVHRRLRLSAALFAKKNV